MDTLSVVAFCLLMALVTFSARRSVRKFAETPLGGLVFWLFTARK